MKILYLITKSTVGGAQTHISQLSRYFSHKGNRVAVMSHPGGWLEKEERRLGIVFYSNKYFSNKPNPVDILKAIKEIKRAVRDFKPDLVSCHSTVAGFLGRIIIKNKIPTIFTAHGWAFTLGVPILRRYLAVLAEKIAARWCSKIICVSEFDKKLALKYKIASPNKIIVIHNGVEISVNQRIYQRKSALTKIVFVGRLGKQKDPMLLLEGFNELEPELKNKSRIFIIGDGPKRKKLQDFIKGNKLEEKVKLLGGLPREEVFEILEKSDIFVLTSNWEGFPRSILEAMSCGSAVIASDVGGVREAINAGYGILIKKGDIRALKDALKKLLKNPQLTQKMGMSARERVKENFSLEKMFKETEKIYREILPNREI